MTKTEFGRVLFEAKAASKIPYRRQPAMHDVAFADRTRRTRGESKARGQFFRVRECQGRD